MIIHHREHVFSQFIPQIKLVSLTWEVFILLDVISHFRVKYWKRIQPASCKRETKITEDYHESEILENEPAHFPYKHNFKEKFM